MKQFVFDLDQILLIRYGDVLSDGDFVAEHLLRAATARVDEFCEPVVDIVRAGLQADS